MCNGGGGSKGGMGKGIEMLEGMGAVRKTGTKKALSSSQEPNKKTQTKSAPVEQSLRSTTTMNKNTTKKKPINKGSKVGSTLLTGTDDYL